jgi:hypothetical protein
MVQGRRPPAATVAGMNAAAVHGTNAAHGALLRELAGAAGAPCWPPSEDEGFAAWIAAHGSPELRALGAVFAATMRRLAVVRPGA